MASLRERKRNRSRDDFVLAALDLFETKGFAETTVEEIADRAMLSPSTFFRYFGTKEDVLFAALPESLEVFRPALASELAEHPPWEAVTRAVRLTTRGFVEQDPALTARILPLWMNEPALRARYMDYADAWEREIVRAVTESQGTDSATDVYARTIAVASIGAFRIAAERFSADDENVLERFEAALKLVGAGLARSSAAADAG